MKQTKMPQVRHTRREYGPPSESIISDVCDVGALGDHFEDNHAEAFNSVFALPALQGMSSISFYLIIYAKYVQ